MDNENQSQKVIANASWIIVCKIVQAVLALVVSSVTARYLGPSNFGLLSYAASIVAFALPITQLGLNCTLVQELVQAPAEEGVILGTSLGLGVVSSFMSMGGIACFLLIVNFEEKTTIFVSLLYSIMLIFQAMELIIYWFQTHYLSKYVSLVSLFAYVIVSIYKIYLLMTGKSISWFAVSNALDYCIIAFILLIIYRKKGGQKLSFSFERGKKLLKKSCVYILSGLMAVIYAQTDRIMLKNMIGDAENGFYSAALYCASLSSFIFSAIIDSMRPYIFSARDDTELYKKRVRLLYSIVIYMGLAYSVFCFVFANILVGILYGQSYYPSAKLLRILVWYCSFTYFGAAQSIWMLAEEKQKWLPVLGGIGAVLNVVLNAILIPIMSATGAAIATVTTAFITNMALCFVFKPLRENGSLLIQSLNPLILLRAIKKFSLKEFFKKMIKRNC